MKSTLVVIMFLNSFFLLGQSMPIEVKNINSSTEFQGAINQICLFYGNELDSELKTELKAISHLNLINSFKKDKTFKKLITKSEHTITFTLISKEYGIMKSYVTMTLKNKTHTYSYDHNAKEIHFVCTEKVSNTFLSFANSEQGQGESGLMLIVNSLPDGGAGIEVINGLSIIQMQHLLYLERYAKNIEK
jgi:hypothetical protein